MTETVGLGTEKGCRISHDTGQLYWHTDALEEKGKLSLHHFLPHQMQLQPCRMVWLRSLNSFLVYTNID